MFRALLTAALVLSPTASAQEPSQAGSDSARVDVHSGRVVLTSATRTTRTLRTDDSGVAEGPTHVEVGAGGRARISWVGRASLLVWGPASLQWDARPADAGADPMATFSTRGLDLHFFDVAWVDLEVRRGQHALRLPGEWRMECGQGAWHLRGLPSGPLEVRHHAGEPATLTWLGGGISDARPPLTIYSGSSLRLDRPGSAPLDEGRGASAWDEPGWPWRNEADAPADRAERGRIASETNELPGYPTRDRDARGPVASVKGLPDAGELRVEISGGEASEDREPAVRRRVVAPDPIGGGTSSSALSPITGRVAPQLPRKETEPPRSSRGFDAQQWRGLSMKQLNSAGSIAVEKSSSVEVRVFPSGRYKILVDSRAEGPAWVFAPGADFLLQPGAVAVFDPGGEMKLSFGEIAEHEPVAGRPSYADIAR